jgi:hypothetical protein
MTPIREVPAFGQIKRVPGTTGVACGTIMTRRAKNLRTLSYQFSKSSDDMRTIDFSQIATALCISLVEAVNGETARRNLGLDARLSTIFTNGGTVGVWTTSIASSAQHGMSGSNVGPASQLR